MDNFKREPVQLSGKAKRFLIIFNCVIAFGIYYMLSTDYNSPRSAAERAAKEKQREQNSYELSAIVQAQDVMRSRLKDPDSAQFRNVGFHRNKKGSDAVCGEVNAHNSFGGYTGFEPFLVTPGNQSAILQADMKAGEFRKVWNARCVE